MKLSWRKKVRIRLDDEHLKSFIKDLLGSSWQWRYQGVFQSLQIDLHIADINDVRRDILSWLERRS